MVAILVLVLLFVLLGMAVLAVDVGAMYTTRGELMVAADAASLSGATFYTTDAAQAIRSGSDSAPSDGAAIETIRQLAEEIAFENTSFGQNLLVDNSDITIGWLDLDNPAAQIDPARPVADFNAVQVRVRKTDGSPNGPLGLFFARVLGHDEANITAQATAAFDDRFAGYDPPGETTPLTPFVVQQDVFAALLESGPDDFGYDADLGEITLFGDGILEVHLFPYKESGDGDGVGSGNFGLLNVGNPNQGVPGLREQFLNGITTEDLLTETGADELTFVDEGGAPLTYGIGGNPGFKIGLRSAVEERLGDVVGFFLYSTLDGQGANTVYTITSIRFGRMLYVQLTGNPDDRTIVVQPVVYSGSDIITSPVADSSGGLLGALRLVR